MNFLPRPWVLAREARDACAAELLVSPESSRTTAGRLAALAARAHGGVSRCSRTGTSTREFAAPRSEGFEGVRPTCFRGGRDRRPPGDREWGQRLARIHDAWGDGWVFHRAVASAPADINLGLVAAVMDAPRQLRSLSTITTCVSIEATSAGRARRSSQRRPTFSAARWRLLPSPIQTPKSWRRSLKR